MDLVSERYFRLDRHVRPMSIGQLRTLVPRSNRATVGLIPVHKAQDGPVGGLSKKVRVENLALVEQGFLICPHDMNIAYRIAVIHRIFDVETGIRVELDAVRRRLREVVSADDDEVAGARVGQHEVMGFPGIGRIECDAEAVGRVRRLRYRPAVRVEHRRIDAAANTARTIAEIARRLEPIDEGLFRRPVVDRREIHTDRHGKGHRLFAWRRPRARAFACAQRTWLRRRSPLNTKGVQWL